MATKQVNETSGFTLAEGATHVGISHNIGGALHKLVESFTHVSIFNNTRRVGFTLAEVLITLGIIGIVSAMTIPTLVKNYQKKVLKNQFIQSYAIINQALGLMKADLGLPSIYNAYTVRNPDLPYGQSFIRKEEFEKEFLKHIKQTTTIIDQNDLPTYHTYSDTNIIVQSDSGTAFTKPPVVLSNGAFLRVSIAEVKYDSPAGRIVLMFMIDVNGSKAPNRYGHDLFVFQVANNNDVLEARKLYKNYTEEELEEISPSQQSSAGNPCSIKSKQTFNGSGCAWYALKDICPDDETKGYWECLPD